MDNQPKLVKPVGAESRHREEEAPSVSTVPITRTNNYGYQHPSHYPTPFPPMGYPMIYPSNCHHPMMMNSMPLGGRGVILANPNLYPSRNQQAYFQNTLREDIVNNIPPINLKKCKGVHEEEEEEDEKIEELIQKNSAFLFDKLVEELIIDSMVDDLPELSKLRSKNARLIIWLKSVFEEKVREILPKLIAESIEEVNDEYLGEIVYRYDNQLLISVEDPVDLSLIVFCFDKVFGEVILETVMEFAREFVDGFIKLQKIKNIGFGEEMDVLEERKELESLIRFREEIKKQGKEFRFLL